MRRIARRAHHRQRLLCSPTFGPRPAVPTFPATSGCRIRLLDLRAQEAVEELAQKDVVVEPSRAHRMALTRGVRISHCVSAGVRPS